MGVLFSIIVFPLAVLFQAWLLRISSKMATNVELGWVSAIIAAIVATTVQAIVLAIWPGSGMLSLLIGFLAWAGGLAMVTALDFKQSAIVGVVMGFIQWLIVLLLKMLAGALGLAEGIVTGM